MSQESCCLNSKTTFALKLHLKTSPTLKSSVFSVCVYALRSQKGFQRQCPAIQQGKKGHEALIWREGETWVFVCSLYIVVINAEKGDRRHLERGWEVHTAQVKQEGMNAAFT